MSEDWLRLQFRVDASYFDQLADLLEACLALSVSIENDGVDEFFEVAFPERPTWKKIRVTALFFDDVDAGAIIDFVQSTLFSQSPVPVITEKMQDQDWVRVWLDQFQPFHIAHDLWIVPSWLSAPEENATNLLIDPGLAFGTGTHATTFLCLEYIAGQNLFEQTILDFGAGSGILAIASLLEGAKEAVAVDIDPLAVQSCIDNAKLNEVSDKFTSINTIDFLKSDSAKCNFDLVIANILAEVLIENAELLLSLIGNNGILLLSGILANQEQNIVSAFDSITSCQFTTYEKDGWLLTIVEKKPS